MTSADILQSHDIKPSIPRVLILDYLRQHRTHPTVDEIYSSLAKRMPTLSRTTVYNTVKLLSSAGIIKTITIEEQQARYDACTDLHGHFLCSACGGVFDFDTSIPDARIPHGFTIATQEVYYTGTCNHCSPKN